MSPVRSNISLWKKGFWLNYLQTEFKDSPKLMSVGFQASFTVVTVLDTSQEQASIQFKIYHYQLYYKLYNTKKNVCLYSVSFLFTLNGHLEIIICYVHVLAFTNIFPPFFPIFSCQPFYLHPVSPLCLSLSVHSFTFLPNQFSLAVLNGLVRQSNSHFMPTDFTHQSRDAVFQSFNSAQQGGSG